MTRHTMLSAMLSGLLLPASTLAAPIEPVSPEDAAPSADTLVADASVVVRAGGVRVSGPAGRVTVTRPPPVPRVAPRVHAAPPPAVSPRSAGSFRVDLQVTPAPVAPRFAPPPPPGASAPPPPSSVAPPPPAGGSVYHPPAPPPTVWHSYRGPTVYYYPRIYSTVWGWWWWAPSCYSCYDYNDAPSRPRQSDDGDREERREREALHVGDYSFGVWGGVQRGLYQDGSVYSDPGLRFSLRHRVSDHLGVDFSGGYFGTPLYPDDADRNSHRVDVPLQLSATFHLFPELPIQVYGLLGVTADYRDFEKVAYTEGTKDFYYTGSRFQDLRFGPNAGLGAEVMIGEDVSIHGDARWTYYSVAAQESVDQTVPASFSANAGVSVYF